MTAAQKPIKFGVQAMADASSRPIAPTPDPWLISKPAPGVLPTGARIAMDDAMFGDVYAYAQNSNLLGKYSDAGHFLGYSTLALLSQVPEYRRMVGTLAQEMTRKWVRLTASGSEDKSAKIELLTNAMEKHNLQAVFREAAEHDGFFGRGQIYIDTGHTDKKEELRTPLILSKFKIRPGSLRGFRCVEAIWSYPAVYNSTDPLRADFYKPQSWYVMGKEIHSSRLLTLVSREVPDILKPVYMFGGVSLTQLAKRYVENWTRTQQNVADLIESFTVWIIKTNMQGLMGEGGGGLMQRVEGFAKFRDNRGVAMVDMESEDIANVSAPLSSLDLLQAQAQEHMASVDGMPLVKFFGIQPAGLNASSEGELECWDDRVHAQQEHIFSRPLKHCLDVIQLDLFGEIDPDIKIEWNPLDEMDQTEKATVRKTEADTAAVLINAGVILPEEERQRLAQEDGSVYSNIDLSEPLPEPAPADPSLMQPDANGGPDDGQDEPPPSGGEAAPKVVTPQAAKPEPTAKPEVAHDEEPRDDPFDDEEFEAAFMEIMQRFAELDEQDDDGEIAEDAAPKWDEAQHRRGPDGKFTSGASSATKAHTATYKGGLGKKKGTASGLIRHLLQKGVSKSEILEEALEHYAKVKKHNRLVQRLHTEGGKGSGEGIIESLNAAFAAYSKGARAEAKAKKDAEAKAAKAEAKAKKDAEAKAAKAAAHAYSTARDVTHHSGTATPEDANMVAEKLSKLPQKMLDVLKREGVRVVACRGNVTDHRHDLKGKQPRGWEPGSTFEQVQGLYSPGRNECVISTDAGFGGRRKVAFNGSVDLVAHEAAHAYDWNTNGMFGRPPEFTEARNKDLHKLGDYELQPGDAGPSETWAESFARHRRGADLKTPALRQFWLDHFGKSASVTE